ncbi:MAG: hypothetical protein FH758_12315 [Firmicutes bacterium]|nr:hypothetical protein [Bacillota bacterium]
MPKAVILFALALITYTLFTFEILVTRLFSAIVWYHFVFIAISLAIFCIGLGGIYVYKQAKESLLKDKSTLYLKLMKQSSLVMAVSIPLNTLAIYKIPFNLLLFLPYLALVAVPFIAAGIFISSAFKNFSGWSHFLYFGDLVGSAIGSVAVINLLNHYSILRVSFMLALAPFLAFLIIAITERKKEKVTNAILISIWLVLSSAILIGGSNIDKWSTDFKAYDGDAKVLGMYDKTDILFTNWNSFSRTDVVDVGETDKVYVMIDGSATSSMVRYKGSLDDMKYLTEEPGYIPFLMDEDKDDALIIGPGGGLDIWLAKLAGIKNVDAVEINAGSVMATEYFAEYSGNPYHLPGVNTYIKDGRTFAELTDKKYNVIYLSKVMTQASEAMGYALSENYIYTLEAFNTYLDRLKPNGKLALVLHGENDIKKAIATAVKALNQKGVSTNDAINSLAVIVKGDNDSDGIMYPVLVVKNGPFTLKESKSLLEMTGFLDQEPLFIPGLVEKNILGLSSNDTLHLSVKPATDDSPFFYNHGSGIAVLLLGVLMVVYMKGRRYFSVITNKNSSVSNYSQFFMLLGAGFMLIEVPLVQKFMLLFGHPTIAFAVVIAVLLLFGGIGSLLGKSLPLKIQIKYTVIFIAVYTFLITLFLPTIFSTWQDSTLLVKVIVTITTLGPLGLVMGIPFPAGLSLLARDSHGDYVPLMWGVNGWMSVVGSILAMLIAMVLGFNWSLLLGATAYILTLVLFTPGEKSILTKCS